MATEELFETPSLGSADESGGSGASAKNDTTTEAQTRAEANLTETDEAPNDVNDNSSDSDIPSSRDVELGLQEESTHSQNETTPERSGKKSVSFREDNVQETILYESIGSASEGTLLESDEFSNKIMIRKDKMEVVHDKPTDPRHHAIKRTSSTRIPMGHAHRRKQSILRKLVAPVNALLPHIHEEEELAEAEDSAYSQGHNAMHLLSKAASERSLPKQYNLRADKSPQGAVAKFFSYLGIQQEQDDVNGMTRLRLCGLSFDQLVIDYLHWCFRSSFMAVFLSAFGAFLAITMAFALVIWIIGHDRPTCIGGVDFENDYFTDAFVLSWTTFSTVGYGVIYPSTSEDEPQISKCTDLTIVMTLEAFVGVLFASFCLAIIFSKVGRAQSFAQVSFCDPILIRFGKGLVVGEYEERDETSLEFSELKDEDKFWPCPLLEIQLVNRLNAVPSGQIMDATINMVASISAEQAKESEKEKGKKRRKKKGKKGGGRKQNNKTTTVQNSNHFSDGEEHSDELLDSVGDLSSSFLMDSKEFDDTYRSHRTLEEDHTGHLFAHRVFQRLDVETQDHPLFQRIWTIRHVLDESSPLIKHRFREIIKACGGIWPKELCTAEGIRAAVAFDEILVSFSGTSMADANTVYAQRVYSYDALNIGYRFVNMLYKGKTGSLLVDHRLINDVTEQAGGGGEAFDEKKMKNKGAIAGVLAF